MKRNISVSMHRGRKIPNQAHSEFKVGFGFNLARIRDTFIPNLIQWD